MKVIGYSRIVRTEFLAVHRTAIWLEDGKAYALMETQAIPALGDDIDINNRLMWPMVGPDHEYVPLTSLHKFLQGCSDEL